MGEAKLYVIKDGVIGGDEPNAADYQIAPSVRLAMSFDDLRPAIESRPAGELACGSSMISLAARPRSSRLSGSQACALRRAANRRG